MRLFFRLYHATDLVLSFTWDLLASNYQVFLFSISPEPLWNPGYVSVEVDPGMSDFQTTLLAHIITVTPGTLTVNVNSKRHQIVVHVLYLGLNTREDIRKSARQTQRRIRLAF